MKLTSDKVGELFTKALYDDTDGDFSDAVIVEGITMDCGFDPDHISQIREEVIELLNELPEEFYISSGGAGSFLNACMDKHGNHWGEHRSVEKLFILGMAIGKVNYLMPKDLWDLLPGGVPFMVVDNTKS